MEAADLINQKPKIKLKLTPLAQGVGLPLTIHSSLSPRFQSMISLNSMASVAQEIGVNSAILKPRAPVEPVDAIKASSQGQGQTQQRMLEAVPAAPTKPMPRGSLLDLRV